MKWGIYSTPDFEGAVAWRDGLKKSGCCGALRSAWDYSSGCFEPFDAVAVFGLHGRGREILSQYTDAGVPVVVIDYGYLKRTNHAHDWRTGHWQVSLGGLNCLPRSDVDSSRFDALNIEISGAGGDPEGYPLICVQTPGDASHGMDQEALHEWCAQMKERFPDAVIRPHPMQPTANYGMPVCQATSLDEALAGARLVITANSNSGHDALLAGVPVIATQAGAVWADLSGESIPSVETRRKHFERCAWGQWTWAEFREGLPQTFVMGKELPIYSRL